MQVHILQMVIAVRYNI